jgi:hypothetical protein
MTNKNQGLAPISLGDEETLLNQSPNPFKKANNPVLQLGVIEG